jgi:hypothetical protein
MRACRILLQPPAYLIASMLGLKEQKIRYVLLLRTVIPAAMIEGKPSPVVAVAGLECLKKTCSRFMRSARCVFQCILGLKERIMLYRLLLWTGIPAGMIEGNRTEKLKPTEWWVAQIWTSGH